MQGGNATCFTIADKIKGQKQKVNAWKNKVSTDLYYTLLHYLTTNVTLVGDYLDATHLQKVIKPL